MTRTIQRDLKELFILMGRMGGRARKKALSPERRREIASQAAHARWKKFRAESHAAFMKKYSVTER